MVIVLQRLTSNKAWQQALNCCKPSLISASVNAGMRTLDGEYKLSKNIKIAMLYLEDDDAVKAEMFIKKASALIASCKVAMTTLGPA